MTDWLRLALETAGFVIPIVSVLVKFHYTNVRKLDTLVDSLHRYNETFRKHKRQDRKRFKELEHAISQISGAPQNVA